LYIGNVGFSWQTIQFPGSESAEDLSIISYI